MLSGKSMVGVGSIVASAVGVLFTVLTGPAFAGSIFVSGHDPDYHAFLGQHNPEGARRLIQRSLEFARDGSTDPILFLKSNTANIPLGDHSDSELGLIASGFTAGTTAGNHFVKVNATEFATVDLSLYSAIFIPSDHGGVLTGNDLKALNARTMDIIEYLNAGGGLVAFAQDGERQPAVPGPEPTNYGFLPFILASTGLSQSETGFTLSPFGESLGLTLDDVNGNFSHNFFTDDSAMIPVDFDASNRVISKAFRGEISVEGPLVVPEPSTVALFGLGFIGIALSAWRKK